MVFVLTGQALKHHQPAMRTLPDGEHLMFVSRHVYLAAASVVNVCLGLYLTERVRGWRRMLQRIGSAGILAAPVFSLIAFLQEPAMGMAGRSWRGMLGVIPMIIGVGLHFVASLGAKRNLAPN
jgi:hypothetical protein